MKNLKTANLRKSGACVCRRMSGSRQIYVHRIRREKRRLRRVVRNHRQSGLRRIQSRTHALFIPANRRRKRHQNIDISAGFPFKQKWNLLDNLAFAAEDEKTRRKESIPNLWKPRKGRIQGYRRAFENLIQVETCHEKLFLDLHEQLKDSALYKRPKAVKWKCSGCGYETTAESAPKECPLCHAKQGAFMLKLNDGN